MIFERFHKLRKMKSVELLLIIITWSLIFYKVECTGSDVSIEQKIKNDILIGYDKTIRPAKNVNDTVSVRLNPGLYCLIDVNSASQEVTLKLWYRMYWKDAFLTWNPEQYGGLRQIRISRDEVWLPDIMILSLTNRNQFGNEEYVVTVESDGSVRSSIDQHVTVYNIFEVSNFPYDTQNITLTYSSRNYVGKEIDLNVTNPTDLAAYNENNEWTLRNYTSWRSLDSSDDNGKTYVFANFGIIITRKPSYYISTFVWPAFIITCLSIIGVFSPFNEAGEREERVTMGLTTLLTMGFVLMIITDQMPKSSNGTPLLGRFIMAEIIISAVVTILATLIIHLHSAWMKNEPVPDYLWAITCRSMKQRVSILTYAPKFTMKSASTRRTSLNGESNAEFEREKLRQDWSKVTKRLDVIFLVIFLIANCIVIVVFMIVGNAKLNL